MSHEQRMKDVVLGHQEELVKDREEKKRRAAREKEKRAFDKLPAQTRMEFWCGACQIDFVAPAYKFWSEVHKLGAWHSVCPSCERMVIRHVNHKDSDPYYEQSAKVRVMRGEAAKDMLQPMDYGFETLYGDPFEHYYRRFQEGEERIHSRYAALGLTGLTTGEKEDMSEFFDTIPT